MRKNGFWSTYWTDAGNCYSFFQRLTIWLVWKCQFWSSFHCNINVSSIEKFSNKNWYFSRQIKYKDLHNLLSLQFFYDDILRRSIFNRIQMASQFWNNNNHQFNPNDKNPFSRNDSSRIFFRLLFRSLLSAHFMMQRQAAHTRSNSKSPHWHKIITIVIVLVD